MTAAITLSIYMARQFTGSVISMLLALSGLVALFDFIELLRRSTSKPEATFALVSEMAALRLPYIAMQILPFAVLLGGILCFWRLTRSSELIVARAAGVSAWEFLAAPTLCALVLGGLATCVVSPVSSAMFARAEALDNTYLRAGAGRWHWPADSYGCGSRTVRLRHKGWRSSTRTALNCTANGLRRTRSACSVSTDEIGCSPALKRATQRSVPGRGNCKTPAPFGRSRCRSRQV